MGTRGRSVAVDSLSADSPMDMSQNLTLCGGKLLVEDSSRLEPQLTNVSMANRPSDHRS